MAEDRPGVVGRDALRQVEHLTGQRVLAGPERHAREGDPVAQPDDRGLLRDDLAELLDGPVAILGQPAPGVVLRGVRRPGRPGQRGEPSPGQLGEPPLQRDDGAGQVAERPGVLVGPEGLGQRHGRVGTSLGDPGPDLLEHGRAQVGAPEQPVDKWRLVRGRRPRRLRPAAGAGPGPEEWAWSRVRPAGTRGSSSAAAPGPPARRRDHGAATRKGVASVSSGLDLPCAGRGRSLLVRAHLGTTFVRALDQGPTGTFRCQDWVM